MLKFGIKQFACLCCLGIFSGNIAVVAQIREISPEHLAEARRAFSSSGTNKNLDTVFPEIGLKFKANFTQSRPDKEPEISKFIDDATIELAPRRNDLENEIDTLYAEKFTQEELKQIADFFSSETGIKFLKTIPVIDDEINQAVRIWSDGIGRDLGKLIGKKIIESGIQ